MVVEYKPKARYVCNYLRLHYRMPVCQNLPADPVDAFVVGAFLDALSPVELDLYGKAVAAFGQDEEQLQRAQRQQIERLRYQAHLAERQYNQTDPDNRLVAAELERRWEAALRDLKDAEARFRHEKQQPRAPGGAQSGGTRCLPPGRTLIPELWRQDRLSQQQKKAFLRSLIDKVVVHRSAPDTVHVRIVWRGGDTTTAALAVTVASMARLTSAEAMEKKILELAQQGKTDEEIAASLTRGGYRSPRRDTVLPSTVRVLRLRHLPVPEAQLIPSPPHSRLPDRVADRAGLGDFTDLDL